MKSLTILSYNIGHLYPLQPWRHIPIRKIDDIFFQHKDIPRIQSIVHQIKPDIIFFQELTSQADAEFLAKLLGFSFSSFCKNSHLKDQKLGTGILYNAENGQIKIHGSSISMHSLCVGAYTFTNVHLNPFSKKKRATQIKELVSYVQEHPESRHIIG